jgi:pSer/pThr/pTyr-binding forkhead associated (FHA) protein
MVIGRADAPGVHIPIRGDPYVSRQHAEMIEVEGGWAVRDLGSTNGTRLNGTQLMGAELKSVTPGDVIELGCCSRLTILPARD